MGEVRWGGEWSEGERTEKGRVELGFEGSEGVRVGVRKGRERERGE